MKKLLFVLVALLSQNIYAQFSLTKEGTFINSEDVTKDYVIFQYEGKHKSELFTAVKKNITLNTKSAKDVTSETENEAISILCKIPYDVFEMTVNVFFEFKDGKIKVNGTWDRVSSPSTSDSPKRFLDGSGNYIRKYRVWNKQGELVNQDNLKNYTAMFNNLVNACTQINQEEDW